MPWVAPAQGVLCGAAHRPLHQALSSPTQGHEKTFLAVQWKIPRKCFCPTKAGDPRHGGMSVLGAALLSPKLERAVGHNSCGRLEFPAALTGWRITVEKRIFPFSSLLVMERSLLQ